MKPKFFNVNVGDRIRMKDNGQHSGKLIGQLREVVQVRSSDYLTREVLEDGTLSASAPCYHAFPKASEYSETEDGFRIEFPFPEEYALEFSYVPDELSARAFPLLKSKESAEGEEFARIQNEIIAMLPEHVDGLALDPKGNVFQRKRVPDFMEYEVVIRAK